MSKRSKVQSAFLCGVLGVWLPAACDTGGLVGGDCKTGRIVCDGECVDPQTDPNNCGKCGNQCAPGLICSAADCVAPGGSGGAGSGGTGGVTSGGTGGIVSQAGAGAGGEGAIGTGGGAGESSGGNQNQGGSGGTTPSGGTSGGPTAGSGGEGGEFNPCVPPFKSADHCGDCNTQCVQPDPICSPDGGGGYHCVPVCLEPLQLCDSRCVDFNTDSDHCGRCYNPCPSGICSGGKCVGASPGHVAVYCMDYTWAQDQTSHTTLLGNATIFLPRRGRVRILGFTTWAPANVRNQVNKVIGWSASALTKTYTLDTITDPATLSSRLNITDYDVFLVYEQSDAPPGELATLGGGWAQTLESFAQAGGVVVVLDGAQGVKEMPDFISSAGLLPVIGHEPITMEDTDTQFYVRAPADQLATMVLSPMSPKPYSCVFDLGGPPPSDVSYVVTDAPAPMSGRPVVIHRVVSR
ncbi:MAG TPA: hypothetical protein VFQ35_28945 [Polyangiaceae bacterium]|nr:hypothetical protein [Polyangiaceae bacterium]